MNTGRTYQHNHVKDLTCEILELTNKGAKVRETQGKKSKIAYYHSIDFDKNKGLWMLIETTNL